MVESNAAENQNGENSTPTSADESSNLSPSNLTMTTSNPVALDDYCLVGWDLDVTGRKLLDEICHIAAYTPEDSFSLFIMPHGDLTTMAKKRHMIRIVTVGFYRIIKDVSSNKMLKTKSEVSALVDFINWLENVNKTSGKNGVLLICHESYKFNPHLLIKSLQKYDLMEKFSNVVKGFVDCHTFAKKKCEQTMVSFSIRILSKVLLDKDNVEIHKASQRAHLAYDIVQHLCAGASEIGNGAASPNLEIVQTLLPFTTSVQYESKVLEDLQVLLSRQNKLKPLFAQYLGFNTTYHERRNALQLRKYLVDAFVDYDMLQMAWSKGGEALEELINDKLSSNDVSKQHKEELLKMIVDHFEKPKKKLSRFGHRSSERSSNEKRESNECEIAETKKEKGELEKMDGLLGKVKELTVKDDIIKPIQNQSNAVKVN